MKKNIILYVLLIFLIISNGFFVFNYIGKKYDRNPRDPQGNKNFIVKELGFNDAQLKQFEKRSKGHHQMIMELSDEMRVLKDELFDKLSDDSVTQITIDSMTSLIGQKAKQKDAEAFRHFKMIRDLCNEKQKEKFKIIIKDALHKGGEQGQMPPPPEGRIEGRRPPPPRNE